MNIDRSTAWRAVAVALALLLVSYGETQGKVEHFR